jgi:16S rRNA (guanine527-N7)-methyltransferase
MNAPGTPSRPDVVEAVFPAASDLAVRYVEFLATTGVEWGLIGPRETDRLWERHVFNSAALADLVPADVRVVDVGSGAGLPGIPLALRRPDLHVTLLEPLLRRATFLTQTVDALGLGDRVEVVRSRAEDHHGTYDVVTSRALAPLPRLLGWCLPLTRRSGAVLALKGRSAQEELDESSRDLAAQRLTADVVSVAAYAGSDPTTIVRVRRA